MKTIGMIGGMSWESSHVYYSHINKMVQERLGGSHSSKSLLTSVDFQEIESLTFADNWEGIGNLMSKHAKILERGGADLIILCTNTVHLVKDHIEKAVSIPFLHIADASGEAIKKSGLKRIGLLGTRFTMEKDFYSSILKARYGIQTVVPDLPDREVLQNIIYNELVKGEFRAGSKQKCIEIIYRLQKKGVEGIILGCTELPILLKGVNLSLPTFDTTLLHAQKAVEFALTEVNSLE